MHVYNVWRHNPENIGDTASSPFRYILNYHQVTYLDYGEFSKLPDGEEPIVIGGSGLFHNQLWYDVLKRLAYQDRRKVFWGVGHNHHDYHPTARIEYPDWLTRYDLIGLRDWLPNVPLGQHPKIRWVPDASCLHHAFALKRRSCHPVVIYEHLHHPIEPHLPFPLKRNNCVTVEEVLNFLSLGDVVLTNTYHGVFWATLLCKEVIIVKPFSSKFYKLKWPQPIIHDIREWETARKETKIYPESLAESIDTTLSFAREVNSLIEE